MCMRYVARGVDDVMHLNPVPKTTRAIVTRDAHLNPLTSINHVKNNVPKTHFRKI